MNCKPGDLAVLIRSRFGNEGRIVRCVRFIGHYQFATPFGAETECWEIDPPLPTLLGATDTAPDAWLRPIRDNDGEDEMLRIAGRPEVVSA